MRFISFFPCTEWGASFGICLSNKGIADEHQNIYVPAINRDISGHISAIKPDLSALAPPQLRIKA